MSGGLVRLRLCCGVLLEYRDKSNTVLAQHAAMDTDGTDQQCHTDYSQLASMAHTFGPNCIQISRR